MTIFLWGKTKNNGLLYFKILAALETPALCLYLTESRFPAIFLYTCESDCRRMEVTVSLWPRLPCFSTVFTVPGCLLLAILTHQISHQAWLWHRRAVLFSLKLFSAMPVLLKCLEDLMHSPPLTLLDSPRVHLSLVHSSCSCPLVISEFTSALSQPEEEFQEHPVSSQFGLPSTGALMYSFCC